VEQSSGAPSHGQQVGRSRRWVAPRPMAGLKRVPAGWPGLTLCGSQTALAPGRLGPVRCGDSVLPSAARADHPLLGSATHIPCESSGKSRVRESRMLGFVRAKSNDRATRPRSDWANAGGGVARQYDPLALFLRCSRTFIPRRRDAGRPDRHDYACSGSLWRAPDRESAGGRRGS
jgi:hypothetical protein